MQIQLVRAVLGLSGLRIDGHALAGLRAKPDDELGARGAARLKGMMFVRRERHHSVTAGSDCARILDSSAVMSTDSPPADMVTVGPAKSKFS